MAGNVTARVSFEPLEAILTRRDISMNQLSKATGVHPQRARVGGLSLDMADKVSAFLQMHPTEVWGDEWIWAAAAPSIPSMFGRSVEDEPGDAFCGRPSEYRAIGRARHYGIHEGAA